MGRAEILVQDLCEEIDFWKEEAHKWETRYNEEVQRDFKRSKEAVERGMEQISHSIRGYIKNLVR